MDCTFCLDCVKACPTENVGILLVAPGSDLLHEGKRSTIGEYSRRPDIAALVLVMTFAAFANAAGMVPQVLDFEKKHALTSWILLVGFISVLPAALASICAWASGKICASKTGWSETLCGMAVLFAPLGFSMWVAHFSFHLLTGLFTPRPVLQRLLGEVGILSSAPDWNIPTGAFAGLPAIEILLLNAGCLFTLWLLWKKTLTASKRNSFLAFLPWALVACGLYAIGVWIILQPMEMRGTLLLALAG
jgi:ferredoxin